MEPHSHLCKTYGRNCARCFGPFKSVNTHEAFPYEMCSPCQTDVFKRKESKVAKWYGRIEVEFNDAELLRWQDIEEILSRLGKVTSCVIERDELLEEDEDF